MKRLSTKKFQKRQFLDFVFKLKNIPFFLKKSIEKLQNYHKKIINFWIKNKARKLSFLKFFCFSF